MQHCSVCEVLCSNVLGQPRCMWQVKSWIGCSAPRVHCMVVGLSMVCNAGGCCLVFALLTAMPHDHGHVLVRQRVTGPPASTHATLYDVLSCCWCTQSAWCAGDSLLSVLVQRMLVLQEKVYACLRMLCCPWISPAHNNTRCIASTGSAGRLVRLVCRRSSMDRSRCGCHSDNSTQ